MAYELIYQLKIKGYKGSQLQSNSCLYKQFNQFCIDLF